MPWLLSDPFAVEDDLREMGTGVWNTWCDETRPYLLSDPTPTNPYIRITQTPSDQVWVGDNIYVRFFPTSDNHVMLLAAIDLMELLG